MLNLLLLRFFILIFLTWFFMNFCNQGVSTRKKTMVTMRFRGNSFGFNFFYNDGYWLTKRCICIYGLNYAQKKNDF